MLPGWPTLGKFPQKEDFWGNFNLMGTLGKFWGNFTLRKNSSQFVPNPLMEHICQLNCFQIIVHTMSEFCFIFIMSAICLLLYCIADTSICISCNSDKILFYRIHMNTLSIESFTSGFLCLGILCIAISCRFQISLEKRSKKAIYTSHDCFEN